MPELTIECIVSASESTKGFGAENLLLTKLRPWKGNAGSDNNLIIKMNKEEVIKSISMGNHFSAFVDVLVANSCDDPPQYSALLPSHSFMDAAESRKEVNGERVKIFAEADMNSAVAAKKWNLIKIICKQPFNNNIPFGLRFLTFFGGTDDVDDGRNNQGSRASGSFFDVLQRRLVEDDVSRNKASEQQALAKQQNQERIKLSCDKMREVRQLKRTHVDSVSDDLPFDYTSNDTANESTLPASTSMVLNNKGEPQTEGVQQTPKRKQMSSLTPIRHKADSVASTSQQAASSRTATPKHSLTSCPPSTNKENIRSKQSATKTKTGNTATTSEPAQPLSGVRFALSGFQNPRRSTIRDRAISLGAEYLKEVDQSTTHLVAAFKNTPKSKQCGTNVIVLPAEWIERCFHEKRRVNESLMKY